MISLTRPALSYSPKRPLQLAFSLVELLAVLAIISILATIGTLTSLSVLGSMALDEGGRTVLDTLNFARETAVSNNVPTVFVVRVTGPNAWQRIAVFSTPLTGSGTSTWALASKWQNLAQNAFIDSTYDPSTEPWTSPANSIAQSSVTAPTSPIQDGSTSLTYHTDYYAIGFLSDGSLQNPNNIALRIIQGHNINGVIKVNQNSSSQPLDWVKLIIVQITGHVKEIREGQ